MNYDETRSAAILRAVLCPTHKLPDDVQRAIEPYLKTALSAPAPHEQPGQAVQLWTGSAPFSTGAESE
jgi:hypothetical protein